MSTNNGHYYSYKIIIMITQPIRYLLQGRWQRERPKERMMGEEEGSAPGGMRRWYCRDPGQAETRKG